MAKFPGEITVKLDDSQMKQLLAKCRDALAATTGTGSQKSPPSCKACSLINSRSKYATALCVLDEFEKHEPHSGVCSDLWAYCQKRLPPEKHARQDTPSAKPIADEKTPY